MSKREQRRYRELERYVTYALLGDTVVFFLYLLFAGFGIGWLKISLAVVAVLASGLGIAFLYLNGELLRPRSRWMGTGFASIIVCILVSLLLNYPSPSPLRPANIPNAANNVDSNQLDGQTPEADNAFGLSAYDNSGSSAPTDSASTAGSEAGSTSNPDTNPATASTAPVGTAPENSAPESSAPTASTPATSAPSSSEPPAKDTKPTSSEPSSGSTTTQTPPPASRNPANWSSVYVGNAEQEEAARKVAKQIADSIGSGTDLQRIQQATRLVSQYRCSQREDKNVYMTAYSVFYMGESCCWGYTSALGMVLDYMGYSWQRGNTGVDTVIGSPMIGSKHQWVIVKMDGHTGYADAQVNSVYYGAYGGSSDTFLESHGSSCSETVVTAATCTQNGVGRYSCSTCNQSQEYTISALGHNSTATEVVPPTATAQGYTVYSCSRCGESYKDNYTNATKSCEDNGSSHSWSRNSSSPFGTCSVCGASEEEYRMRKCIDGSGNHYWMRFGASNSMFCYYCKVQLPLDESKIHDAIPGYVEEP